MNKKLFSAAALVMSGVMAFSACELKSESVNDYDKTVVATVGKEDVTLADYNFAYYSNASQFEQYYSLYMGIEDWESQVLEEGGQTCGEYVRENALTETKQLMVAEQKAKKYGIVNDKARKEEIQKQKAEVIEQNFGGEEGYNSYLESFYTSDAAIERYLTRASIINALLEEMSKDGGECAVPDSEIEYSDDVYLKVKHVLIKTGDDVSDEEALAKANEVVEKLNNGEDMQKLVEEYNEDPGMESQDYYVFTDGEMVDEFYQASKNLEIGTWTTEPVKTSYGYHVIYRYALEKTDDKFNELKTTKAQTKFMELLNGWIEETECTVDDDAIDKALEAQKEAKKAAQEAQNAAQQSEEENSDADDSADNGDDNAADGAADTDDTPNEE